MNYIIMVLTSLIWWSLCIQSQIELEPQDFRTCTETFRAKSCRWKCIFNIALLFVNISSNITSFFRFLTSTIPSWFRRYGNQRCYIWRVLATHQTQNLLFNYIPDQVYFPNAKEAEFQYVTVPNLLLSIKPLGQILYMLRSQFSCKHHNHIPKSLSTI